MKDTEGGGGRSGATRRSSSESTAAVSDAPSRVRKLRPIDAFILTLLAIAFFDEFVFGVREAAWPLVRDDLGLTYAQIGVVLAVPGLFSSVVEPVLGILGDVWHRRLLILAGGAGYLVALLLTGLSENFALLLVAFTVMYPASGAFVTLSQATLMDADARRRQQNMARWTLAGSLGMVLGPFALAAVATAGLGWRRLAFGLAGVALLLLVVASRVLTGSQLRRGRPGCASRQQPLGRALKHGGQAAVRALRRREVVRWLALLQLGDTTGDILLGYLALYFVDSVGVAPAQAGLAVAVWTGLGLLGDIVTVPLLERAQGLDLVRLGAAARLLLLPGFLLVRGYPAKLVLLGLLSLSSLGWYAVLQAQLYSAMPGRSGTVMTVGNIGGLVGSLVPLGLGIVAQKVSLAATMWLLLAGPIALLVGVPGRAGKHRHR